MSFQLNPTLLHRSNFEKRKKRKRSGNKHVLVILEVSLVQSALIELMKIFYKLWIITVQKRYRKSEKDLINRFLDSRNNFVIFFRKFGRDRIFSKLKDTAHDLLMLHRTKNSLRKDFEKKSEVIFGTNLVDLQQL